MTASPLISVCIPVYNGAKYIAETLEKIYNQTYTNLEILISIDLSSDQSIEQCSKINKSNTKIFIQPIRLGWVENCNFLIRQSNGEYFSIIPQDDLIPANYFEKLLEGFNTYPNAVNCFPYIICFGNLESIIYQKSIVGSLNERIQEVIQHHYSAVSFRGLVKKKLPDHILHLDKNQHQNMMSDSIWILQHALAGDLYSIDVPYYKRYHQENEHSSWTRKSIDDKIAAWAGHCATLYNISAQVFDNNDQLYQYCIHRLLNSKINDLNLFAKKRTRDLLNKFDEKINVFQ